MQAALPCFLPCAAAPSSGPMAQSGTRRARPGNVAGVSFPVAYDFLAAEDVNKDKIQDILFLYKNTNSSRGNSSLSCADGGTFCFYPKAERSLQEEEGSPGLLGVWGRQLAEVLDMPTSPPPRLTPKGLGPRPRVTLQPAAALPPGCSCPCTFVAAVSGASGSVLWERPVAQDGAFVECGILQPRGSSAPSACVVLGRPGSLVAVDTLTGGLLPAAGLPGSRVSGLHAPQGSARPPRGQRIWTGGKARAWGP